MHYIFSLMSMLKEYQTIKDSIPTVVQPLMKPLCDYVERALKPGLSSLTWTSFNIESCEQIGFYFIKTFFVIKFQNLWYNNHNIVFFNSWILSKMYLYKSYFLLFVKLYKIFFFSFLILFIGFLFCNLFMYWGKKLWQRSCLLYLSSMKTALYHYLFVVSCCY